MRDNVWMNETELSDAKSALLQKMLADGVVASGAATLTAFGGGVSSDVYLVEDGERKFVAKQVLAQLRVAQEWTADVSRIESEEEYLRWVGKRLPSSVPRLLHVGDGYFTMEFLKCGPDGKPFENWKQQMLAGVFDVATARRAGEFAGSVHRLSFGDAAAAQTFRNTGPLFLQLRLSPYLLTTAERHPQLRAMIEAEVARLAATRECLVHGDFSPKNMLVSGERLIVLDCETAWWGDAAFDVAFVMTHLLLKPLQLAGSEKAGAQTMAKECAEALVAAYFAERALEDAAALQLNRRIARLLQMILLARVDGKSPAEYLVDAKKKDFLRAFVYAGLTEKHETLAEVIDRWHEGIAGLVS